MASASSYDRKLQGLILIAVFLVMLLGEAECGTGLREVHVPDAQSGTPSSVPA
uniref:Uncharacterized protein n=1 Tax=Physcomitrium patens TaxID=3218 RepID=A0A2K1JRD0_PHYPA|nr:hypothetical protein PHYPA_016466 [Physcomitrium patens]